MIDFPASPTDGQVFNAPNGVAYQYSATYSSWLAQSAAPGVGPYLPLTGGTLAGPGTLVGTTATFTTADLAVPFRAKGATYLFRAAPHPAGMQLQVTDVAEATYGPLFVDASLMTSRTPLTGTTATLSGTIPPSSNDTTVPTTAWVRANAGSSGTGGTDFYAAFNTLTGMASAITTIIPPVVTGNAGGYYNFSNGRYTPPAGRYLLFGSAVTGYASGAIVTYFYLRKNGVVVQQSWETPANTAYYNTNKLEAILDANGTDYFDFTLYGSVAGGTYQGVYIGATPVTGLTGPQGPAGPANPSNVLRGFLSGGVHSSAGSTQALTIGAVAAADSTNSVWINSTVAFTKFIAGGWVAGNGSAVGGMGPGLALSVNTWYFPFAATINGAFDIFFDNSVTPTHIPAGTTAYRRLRPIKTDGSGNILAHSGKGDLVQWNTAIRDINLFNLSSVGTLTQVMSAPPIQTMIQGRLNGNNSSGAFYVDIVTPGLTGQNVGVVGVPSGQQAAAFFSVLSDATGALKFVTGGGTSNSIYVDTYGWIDECGRHD